MKHVYFLRPEGERGPIKIGCSKMPTTRLRDVEIWSPIKLELIVAVEGDHREESILHQMFGDQRRHGEWFEYTDQLGQVIQYALRAGKLPPLDRSLNPYAQKRADPKARSKMTRRNDPIKTRDKWRITTAIMAAERRVYGFHGHEFIRPYEVDEVMRSYQGFASPLPDEKALILIREYIEKLNELPSADRSFDRWLDWHKMIPHRGQAA